MPRPKKQRIFLFLSRRSVYWLGNTSIACAIVLFIFIYGPFIQLLLFPRPYTPRMHGTAFSIEIPKIRAAAPIVTNVDPWNETDYRNALTKGVAHAKGSALPDEPGSVYLFAHSSDAPWRITSYNTVFFRLAELQKGDSITIWYNGKKFLYSVRELRTVSPQDVSYLTQSNKNQLVLQTCTPIGTAWKRLLVFSNPLPS